MAHPSVPIVAVINPASGPGIARDVNYAGGIDYLTTNGVPVLGYIPTAHGLRPSTQVNGDVVSYASWYPNLAGIFFDEVASGDPLGYYKAITTYARNAGMNPRAFLIGNPGTRVQLDIAASFDNVVVYEGILPPALPVQTDLKSSMIIHDQAAYPSAIVDMAKGKFGYLYITNQPASGNTYGVISPHLEELVADLDLSP